MAQVSNWSKVPCSRKQQQNWAYWALSLEPLDYQANAPTTGLLWTVAPPRGSPYLCHSFGREVTKFIVAQVSNWSKVPCSRKQQQQNWAYWGLNLEPLDYQANAPTTGLLLPPDFKEIIEYCMFTTCMWIIIC